MVFEQAVADGDVIGFFPDINQFIQPAVGQRIIMAGEGKMIQPVFIAMREVNLNIVITVNGAGVFEGQVLKNNIFLTR